MKNIIPDFKSKAERFAYLRANKSKLVAQKKALPTTTDDLDFGYTKTIAVKVTGKKDDAAEEAAEVEGELQVDIIGNLAGWCDSQQDVMIKDNWNKSISDVSASGEKLSYHLKNHDYCMDAIVGKDPSLYTKDIDLSIFNFTSDIKKAQGLIMSSTVMESYDEKVFNLYTDKQVKQHSIGLQYIQISLCLDSTEEEDKEYKKNWDKYYPQVINKDKVDNYGYFWAVTEAKILEVSCVLWGSNILTPVLSSGQPPKSTGLQPQSSTADTEENGKAKSVIGCPACDYLFVAATEGNQNCPNCGQFVSPQSTTIMMSEEITDLKKAIEETNFFSKKSQKMNMNMAVSSDPTEAAIQFIDEMIPHHQLALDMVSKFKPKVDDEDLIAIMDDILTSQQEQINEMQDIKDELQNGKQFNFIDAVKETDFITI